MITRKNIPANPQAIAEIGEKIYNEKYRDEYERTHIGKFVAISLNSENLYIGDNPVDAYKTAQEAEPTSFFHLIKIGSEGVYKVGYSSTSRGDWLFQKQ